MTPKLLFECDLVAAMTEATGEKPGEVYWGDFQKVCPPELPGANVIATTQMRALLRSAGPNWGIGDPDARPTLQVYECQRCEGALGSFCRMKPIVEPVGYSAEEHYYGATWTSCEVCAGSGIQIQARRKNSFRSRP